MAPPKTKAQIDKAEPAVGLQKLICLPLWELKEWRVGIWLEDDLSFARWTCLGSSSFWVFTPFDKSGG